MVKSSQQSCELESLLGRSISYKYCREASYREAFINVTNIESRVLAQFH